jgi:hypothetical protein
LCLSVMMMMLKDIKEKENEWRREHEWGRERRCLLDKRTNEIPGIQTQHFLVNQETRYQSSDHCPFNSIVHFKEH